MDNRFINLAKNLVHFSCQVAPGERVLIEATDTDPRFVECLVSAVYEAQGHPFVAMKSSRVERALRMDCNQEQIEFQTQIDAKRMQGMNAYIGVRGEHNSFEMADVPSEKTSIYQKIYWKQVHGQLRVPGTKWVVLRWPHASFAQAAGMSTQAFEDFYFNVCCLDYAKMDRAMDALVSRMANTDRVRLVGKGTDISFSIKGIPAIKCSGHRNIPDGEVFTAPVKDSIEGVITFASPQVRDGFSFENIQLEFHHGKIVHATANDTKWLNAILDTDEGARYVGEFAIGVNPYITRPMGDTLFDEKITGSIHLTPGSCYEEADNGNHSAIHWDMVLVQTPQFGSGEIWFDQELVRKDGVFITEDLKGLNPDALK